MQEKDTVSIDYFEDAERFADLINGYIYSGEKVILPEDIIEVSRSSSRIKRQKSKRKDSGCNNNKKIYTQTVIADVVRKVKQQQFNLGTLSRSSNEKNIMRVVLVALESQTDIHYAMPIRVMNAESVRYHQQWRRKAEKHKKQKDLQGAEYLSGFGKTDKLTPVITIVIYWGKEPWDAPRSLKEMLDMSECPDAMQDMIADYPIHLLEVRKYADLSQFHTDIRYVFGFLQNDDDKETLRNYLEENREVFTELSQSAYDMISVMSHSEELQDWQNENIEEGGTQNMCKAITDMIKEGREEGREEGLTVGIQLVQRLLTDGRSGEIERIASDSAYQQQLLKEYGLI